MSTAGKLWAGFGLLLLLLVGIGMFVSHRLRVIDQALTTITAVREPASAATYEMEVTLLGASTAVLDYVSVGAPDRRAKASEGFANFDRVLLEYDRIARSEASRGLGRRIAQAYQVYRSLGDTLMTLSEERRTDSRDFWNRSSALRGIIEGRLESAIADGRDADRKSRETARFATVVSDIGAIVGSRGQDAASPASQLDQAHGDFRAALARYRRLRLSPAEGRADTVLESRFTEYVAQARDLVTLDERMRLSLGRFLAQRSAVENLIGEGIQALARIDLDIAQASARRAVQTSLLAVLVLLAAGITIVSVTALPAGRGIVQTERQLREQTGELALAHRRKDEFLGVLGHELRNPLSPLSNTLHVLASRESELPESVRRAHDTMRRQVQHISRLVDDLLDVSRINEGKIALRRERVDAADAVAQAAANLRPVFDKRGIALRVARAHGPAWVDADPVRLDQVITNVLNNAAKYTPAGGSVEVTTTLEASRVVVRVRDTGIGIPPEMLSRVFEPFVQAETGRTRAFGGLGIGLTLVQRLVELHGGSVQAESAGAGAGSTFIVTLPLLDASRPVVVPRPAPAAKQVAPRRILVVDDSETAATTMAELLGLWGHQVHVALDGDTALRAISEHPPDVVFLDIALPGMDGYEVCERVRRLPNGQRIRLVALTGFGQDGDRRRAMEVGFDEHVTKPVTPTTLAELLSRA